MWAMVFVTFASYAAGFVAGLWETTAEKICEIVTEDEMVNILYSKYYNPIWIVGVLWVLFHLPYYFILMRWCFRTTKEYFSVVRFTCSTLVGSVSPTYVGEKYITGSEYVPSTDPAFQVSIYSDAVKPGEFQFQGIGWRLSDTLITAYHVIADVKTVRIRANDSVLDLVVANFIKFEHDLAAIELTSSAWADLKVKTAKVTSKAVDLPIPVKVVSRNSSTTGTCRAYGNHPLVVYDGSTRSGFSGAPYFVGNTVFGMHTGSSNVNLGVDAAWIKAAIWRNEDSSDTVFAIMEQDARSGKKTFFSVPNGEDIIILSRGKYHSFERDEIPSDLWAFMEYDGSGKQSYTKESIGTYESTDVPTRFSKDLFRELQHADATEDFNEIHKQTSEVPFLDLRSAHAVAEANLLKKASPAPSQSILMNSRPSTYPVLTGLMAGLESTTAARSRVSEDTRSSPRRPSWKQRNQAAKKRKVQFKPPSQDSEN